jgi:uncharacterized protein YprB with RNaseH-like and TPR domain
MDAHELVKRLKALASNLGRTPTLKEFEKSGISKRQIVKHKYSNLCKMAGLEINRHAAITEPIEPEIRPPRILFFDIETAPITGYTWGTYEQTVIKVLKDWFVLSYAAKFQGDERFFYLDQRFSNPIDDDYQLLCGIHHLLSEADICVSHNGAKFDHKKLNARFIKHGLAPLSHYQVVDTLKIARKHFAFTSNKLADLATFLSCSIQKSTHAKFPGFSMWDECMKGNQEAFQEMESYNKTDVDVLEAVFNRLAPWEPSLNLQSFYQKPTCICGNQKFYKNGYKYSKQGKFQVYSCSVCFKSFIGKQNLIDKDIRAGFHK